MGADPHAVTRFILLSWLVAAGTAGAAAASSSARPAFAAAPTLDSELKRGVSTAAEVRRVLGPPTGQGAMLQAAIDSRPFDLWYYEDLAAVGTTPDEEPLGSFVHKQLLLVFFRDGVFQGYLWYSNLLGSRARAEGPLTHGGRAATGFRVRFNELANLEPDGSTRADVLMALGEPLGTGGMRWCRDLETQTVWVYEYITGSDGTAHVDVLLIYLAGDRYRGYLWFSGDPVVALERLAPGAGR